jgi:TonB family protein
MSLPTCSTAARTGILLALLFGVSTGYGTLDEYVPAKVALDAKGRRYLGSDYEKTEAPWKKDSLVRVLPDWSVEDRRRGNVGAGLYRMVVDVKTGKVASVTVLRSTGHRTLDDSVANALRQWRWKPGTWKQFDIPVTFTMGRR